MLDVHLQFLWSAEKFLEGSQPGGTNKTRLVPLFTRQIVSSHAIQTEGHTTHSHTTIQAYSPATENNVATQHKAPREGEGRQSFL